MVDLFLAENLALSIRPDAIAEIPDLGEDEVSDYFAVCDNQNL
jgi:hypothetical protein